MQHHVRPPGTPPTNGYSHAVSFSGATVAVSGQVPLDSDGAVVGAGDAPAQIRQVFENLRATLAAAGADPHDLIKLTIYLTDMADLAAFRRIRDEYINLDRPPASTLVQVSGLVNPAFRIELEAWATVR